MAISAKFEADFNDFKRGVAEAEGTLEKLGAGAERAQLRLVKMEGATTKLGGSLRQFDGALATVGVNLSPQIRAIEELENASGKTAGQLGKLATAGLAASAAMAGWEFGRMIAGWLGLDQAIAGATARLVGWGDVAAETAGAKQDTINKAIANGADAWISYTDAIKFNQQAHDAWKGPLEAADKLKKFEASLVETADAANNLTRAEKDVIDQALAVGKSHAEIADALGLTTDVVDLYVKSVQAAAKAEAEAGREAKTLGVEALPAVKVAAEAVAVSGERMGGVLITALEAATQAAAALGESLDSIKARGDAARESFVEMGHRVTDAAGQKGSDLGKAYGRGLDEFPSRARDIALFREAGLADWQILNILLGVATFQDYQATLAKKSERAPARGSAAAGSGASGGRAGSGAGAGSSASLSAGGASLTSGREGPVIINVGVQVSGVWDPAAKQAMDRIIDESVTRSLMRARKLSVS